MFLDNSHNLIEVSLAHSVWGKVFVKLECCPSKQSDLLGFWGNQLFGCPVSSPF